MPILFSSFSFTSFLISMTHTLTYPSHRSGQPRLLRAVQALGCGLEDGVALGKNGSKNAKGKATAKAKGGGKWEIELDCLVGLSSGPVGCRMELMCLFSLLAFSFVDPISRIPDAPPSRLRLIRSSSTILTTDRSSARERIRRPPPSEPTHRPGSRCSASALRGARRGCRSGWIGEGRRYVCSA
jgi:hypothetical protein